MNIAMAPGIAVRLFIGAAQSPHACVYMYLLPKPWVICLSNLLAFAQKPPAVVALLWLQGQNSAVGNEVVHTGVVLIPVQSNS